MKSQEQTLSDLLKEAVSIWKKEAYEITDNSVFQDLEKDPIVRLLLSALLHQTNILENSIDNFESQIVAQYIANTLPYHLVQPNPAFSMMQTYKVHDTNDSECFFVDQNTSFEIIPTGQNEGKCHFVPLVHTHIIDAEVVSVQHIEDGQFMVMLKCNENLSDLSNVAFCFPKVSNSSVVSVYSGSTQLPVLTSEHYDRLPYIDLFNNSIRFYGNSLQYGVFVRLMELMPRFAMSYCMIDKYNPLHRPLLVENNCIILQFEFSNPSSVPQLHKDDILINCFPIINIDIASTTLSSQTPIRKIDLKDSFLLTIGSISNYDDNDDIVAIRQINTERFTQAELFSILRNLVNKFNTEYYLFKEILDKKTENAIQQLVLLIDEVCKNQSVRENDTYLMLRHQIPNTIGVKYLTTLGAKANAINPSSCQIFPSTAIIDAKRTCLLMSTVGGKNEITDVVRIGTLAKYYALTNDRLVSRSDISNYCKKELQLSFGYKSQEIISISISKIIHSNSSPFILVNIVVKDDHGDFEKVGTTLENLIQSKTTTVFPVKVSISLYED